MNEDRTVIVPAGRVLPDDKGVELHKMGLQRLLDRLGDRLGLLESRLPSVTQLVSTFDTGLLGGAFLMLPGLSATLYCAAGRPVLLDAGVTFQWNSGPGVPSAFFGWRPAAGAWTYLTDAQGRIRANGGGWLNGDGVTVPVSTSVVPTVAGNYEFSVFCQAAGGAGYGIGASQGSHARIVRL